MKPVTMLLCLVVMVGCSTLERLSAGERPPGYLDGPALPDSVVLIPPPPAAGSAAFRLDQETSAAGLELMNSARWDLAARDAELSLPAAAETFTCALGCSPSPQHTPNLLRLMGRMHADVSASVSRAKRRYQRPRPFMVNGRPVCTPEQGQRLRWSGSYPSGHTAAGWAWALILSELVPERGDEILRRGRAFGRSRIVCNVHWLSDVEEGRTVAAAVVARLHADPGFRADLELARAELAALRSGNTALSRDCTTEAGALALFP